MVRQNLQFYDEKFCLSKPVGNVRRYGLPEVDLVYPCYLHWYGSVYCLMPGSSLSSDLVAHSSVVQRALCSQNLCSHLAGPCGVGVMMYLHKVNSSAHVLTLASSKLYLLIILAKDF